MQLTPLPNVHLGWHQHRRLFHHGDQALLILQLFLPQLTIFWKLESKLCWGCELRPVDQEQNNDIAAWRQHFVILLFLGLETGSSLNLSHQRAQYCRALQPTTSHPNTLDRWKQAYHYSKQKRPLHQQFEGESSKIDLTGMRETVASQGGFNLIG